MKKAAKETIVGKPVGQIVITLFLLAFFIAADLWLILKSGGLITGCLFLPLIIAWFFAALYSCRWKLVFSPKEIRYRRLFVFRTYHYTQIKEVTQYLSYPEGEIVWITFYDGKQIRFSSGYRNFAQGTKAITAHHSIKRVTK